MNYEKLSKNALKCIYVGSGILDIIVAMIALLVWRIFLPENRIAKIVVLIICAVMLFELLINPIIRYNRYRYAIDEECIDIIEGLFFIRRDIVPIERLHKIAVERGPIDRMFGLGKVLVTTAGGDVTIRYLELEKAEKIAENLKHRINEVAAQTRGGEDDR